MLCVGMLSLTLRVDCQEARTRSVQKRRTHAERGYELQIEPTEPVAYLWTSAVTPFQSSVRNGVRGRPSRFWTLQTGF
jgi:hypothetical protein